MRRLAHALLVLLILPALVTGQVTVTSSGSFDPTGTNKFTGQTDISGPDSTTNVEIGSTANDANAGTGGTSVVIGNGANNTNNSLGVTVLGSVASASSAGNIAIGRNVVASGTRNYLLGDGLNTSTASDVIAIGGSNPSAANQIVLALPSAAAAIIAYIGKGLTNASAVSTTISATGGSGADNVGGDNFLAPGPGTGAAAGGKAGINRNLVTATSSTPQVQAPAYVACPTKILSNSSATAQTMATITTTSTTGGSVKMFFTVVANNGTLQDTDAGEIVIGWNNNAGTVAVAASTVYGQMDSDASGTLATTPTVTAATNVVSVKFTPTWVTIVPTTVTGFATFEVNGVNSIACQ